MKLFLLKYCTIAFIFMNAILVYSQFENRVDSLITVVNDKITNEDYIDAENIIETIKSFSEYQTDSIQFKVDFSQVLLYIAQNKNQKGLEILLEGLSKSKKNQNAKYISIYAFELGKSFSGIKNYSKANKYYRLLLKNSKLRNDSIGVSKGYLSLGSIHLKLVKSLDTAHVNYKMHNDSTYYYHQKALTNFPKNTNNKIGLTGIYNNLIGYYFFKGDYDLAGEYGKKSLEIFESLGDSTNMATTLNNLGATNALIPNYSRAENYYFKGLGLVLNKKDLKSLERKRNFYLNIADLNNRKGEYKKAYEYRIYYEDIRDTLVEVGEILNLNEIEAKYNVAEEEKQTELEKNRRKNAEMWLYIVAASTTVLLLFVWLFNRTQKIRREKELLFLQKEALTKEREIEKLNNESQIKILTATIDGKEMERQQIAEILHNSVSALLSSAGLHLQAAKIELKDNAPKEISKSQAIISEAGDKIRDLSHTLISAVLMKFGLGYAMDDLCEKYSNSTLVFESDAVDIQRYNSEFEIKIFSIIEELLNNIIKHSNATTATILLKQVKKNLEVRIFDDGHGFDVNKLRKATDTGLGLPQIDARIKMMDGIFEIKSSEEMGTRIYMKLPIPK